MSTAYSLRWRLLRQLLLVLPVLWLLTSIGTAFALFHEMAEVNDTQMNQLARHLLSVSLEEIETARLPENESDLPSRQLKQDAGHVDQDDMGFAIWDEHGRLILSDEKGSQFAWRNDMDGFYNQGGQFDHKAWRMLTLASADGEYRVTVGQKMAVRREILFNTVWAQLLPWLVALPLLLLAIFSSVRRGLQPLNQLVNNIGARAPSAREPLPPQNVPKEILPLVAALNRLFERVADAMERENRFTADAAHELRSPLAALQVQLAVLAQTEDETERLHVLHKLEQGLARANHLIEQLLTLARIDPGEFTTQSQTIDWATVSERALSDVSISAREKQIQLKRVYLSGSPESSLPVQGDAMLLGLLLRNLLDNAVRYSPPGSVVTLQLAVDSVAVLDNGPGLDPAILARVCERFYRPPGQKEQGSGLGLSIAERIAGLHRLRLHLENRPEGGLAACLSQQSHEDDHADGDSSL